MGGSGNDLLVAGALASVLNGGAGEDILIGGSVIDSTFPNLDAIRAIWKGTGDYVSRATQLRGSLLSDPKVTGNDQRDTLTGMVDALDLFFGELAAGAFAGDLLTDRIDTEFLQPLA